VNTTNAFTIQSPKPNKYEDNGIPKELFKQKVQNIRAYMVDNLLALRSDDWLQVENYIDLKS
jgi:hypothetical protein